jgi:hypothetical protein
MPDSQVLGTACVPLSTTRWTRHPARRIHGMLRKSSQLLRFWKGSIALHALLSTYANNPQAMGRCTSMLINSHSSCGYATKLPSLTFCNWSAMELPPVKHDCNAPRSFWYVIGISGMILCLTLKCQYYIVSSLNSFYKCLKGKAVFVFYILTAEKIDI